VFSEKVETASLSVIEVSSRITPYNSTNVYAATDKIQSWNYPYEGYREHIDIDESSDSFKHSFSGTYGINLLDEVNRYAEVASQLCRRLEFDIIHVHDWMTMPAGIAGKVSSGKPLIVHVHSTEYDRSGENINPVVFEIEKEGLQAADFIFAVSQWTKDILTTRYGIQGNKVQVLHNGIIQKKTIVNSEVPSLGSHIVTFLGRITYQKGPLYFVRAAQLVLEKFPDAHFIVAGSGDMFPLVIEKVAGMKLSSRFHFTGFLKSESVDKIWAISSVYVMPSVSEPFGITTLEAIQAGVPVIVSNQSGVSEVMPHAIKVDFWKTEELADAICTVLAYPSLSSTLQKNAQEEIKRITWDKAAEKIKSTYYELTA
jgi:glycosyltransferase involved in cell wall biosynthesis